LIDVGTKAVAVERYPLIEFVSVGSAMIQSRLRQASRRFYRLVTLAAALYAGATFAQVPIPMEEQVQLFNSLPPAQQQSLIRELQRQLPPAQREAVLGMLQGGGGNQTPQSLDPAAAAVLNEALQAQAPNEMSLLAREPRLRPRDTLVIRFDASESSSEAEQLGLTPFRERLAEGNPYELDDSGILHLPGVPAIALAGLDVDEATVRVQAEPELEPFAVVLTFLPLDAVGTEALEPFGYDLFERVPSTFAPATDIPVPVDYVLGPGDTVNVQLFDAQSNEYFLPVNRDGTINFPELGPINVSGLTFAEMRDTINERVQQQLVGVRVSVTLGELRSIRIFVLGDVVRPGTYTVSSLSTMINALFASGGVKPIGSLRNIQLRRDGNTVSTLDLYDLLLSGDTSGDALLQPGDAIFVPPIGPTVTVQGQVHRPAIYEVDNEPSIAAVIALAGGLTPVANRAAVTVERIVPNSGTAVEDVDLATDDAQARVRNGDVLRVPRNLERLQNSVQLAGNVFQPGPRQWVAGMRLTDLLPGPQFVQPLADLNYVLIRRELAPNVNMEVLSADLQAAWQSPTSAANVALQPGDTVYIFNIEIGRRHIVSPLIDELEAQAPPQAPQPIVRIGGQVRAAGEYPLEPGMFVSDLLRAGGGLSEAAYATDAELTRYVVVNGEYRETELVTVNLAALVGGDSSADVALAPYDYLNVKELQRWRGEDTVIIRGEVAFPGEYPIRRGEMLSSVLMRAGGLTDLAFPQGSVFTREELAERERNQLQTLANRLERDLAAMSISDSSAGESLSDGQALLTQLRTSVATGRLVIRLDDIVAGIPEADVVLKDGDQLLVPDARQEVTVLGEIQYATSHLYEAPLSRDDYIERSGGFSQRADDNRVYVVRANGAVVPDDGGGWFRRETGSEIRPGDAIVVPLDLDQPLQRWAAITQIIYNLAIAAAAVNSF